MIIYVHIYIYDSNYIYILPYIILYHIYIDHVYIYIDYMYICEHWFRHTSGGDPIGLALLDQRPDAEPAPAPQLGHG